MPHFPYQIQHNKREKEWKFSGRIHNRKKNMYEFKICITIEGDRMHRSKAYRKKNQAIIMAANGYIE